MNDEEIQEQKSILENKIAHLCNEFNCDVAQGGYIEDIHVYHGPCKKGWFLDEVINIDINLIFTQSYPVAYVEQLEYELKKRKEIENEHNRPESGP